MVPIQYGIVLPTLPGVADQGHLVRIGLFTPLLAIRSAHADLQCIAIFVFPRSLNVWVTVTSRRGVYNFDAFVDVIEHTPCLR